MGYKNGAMRIRTKSKKSIISIEPKDFEACDNCVYAYPRNISFNETTSTQRIVLGAYEDNVYANEALDLLWVALSKERDTFEMPDELELDKYEDSIRQKVFNGEDNIVISKAEYHTSTYIDDYDDEFIYTEGTMIVIDGNKEVYLTIRIPGVENTFDFTVNKSKKHIQDCYHTIHELSLNRYKRFFTAMHEECVNRNKSTLDAVKTDTPTSSD